VHLLASLLFVPAPNWKGEWLPVLVVGWTLTFEMLFYAVIAMALRWRWRMPVEGAAAVLAFGALLGLARRWPMPWGILTDPLLLEFGLGVAAWWACRLWSPSRPTLRVCIATAVAVIVATSAPGALEWRVACWGAPSAVLVWALVVRERQSQVALEVSTAMRMLDAMMLRLGDASYSIYLFHLFAIKIMARAAIAAHVAPGIAGTIALEVLAILVSAGLGVAIHRAVELPLLTAAYRVLARSARRARAES
jgi:exopolysaccharide production protein ExoZ